MTAAKKTIKLTLAFAGAVISPILALPIHAQAQMQNATSALQVYSNSLYGFCDAKKIAFVWGRDIKQAKIVIGTKIQSDLQNLIDRDIQSARGRSVACNFEETGLSFKDAKRLARYWGRSIDGAKTKAAQMVSEKGTKGFRQVMADALRI